MKSSDFTSWASGAAILSVQTAPSTATAKFMPTFTAPTNYRDPIKKREYVDSKVTSYIEKAALDAMRAEIVVAGLLGINDDEVEFFCVDPPKDESSPAIIKDGYKAHFFKSESNLLLALLGKLDTKTHLVGQALTSFHLPMLIRRSLCHGFQVPDRYLPKPRYFNSYNCFDFCEAWSLGKKEDQYVSLENLVMFFFPNMDPKDLPLSVTDTATLVNRFRKGPITTLDDFALSFKLIQEIAPMLYIVRNHPIPDLK